jgi:hypothetical protein
MSAFFPAHGDEPLHGARQAPLYNLVYCSRATPGTDEAVVDGIIATARKNNPRMGITGLLVFGSGIFFQWLEGPRDNIASLLVQLRRDPRHDTLVVLSEDEEVRERLFPDWDMELVTAEHIRDVLHDAQGAVSDPASAQSLRRLLEQLDAAQVGDRGGSSLALP